MDNNSQNKITELVLKLSLSGLPPSFQEYVLSHLDKLDEANLSFITKALDKLAEKEGEYLEATEKYKEFYQHLSAEIKEKLKLEANKIEQELLDELV
jgi:hypothetical protein